VDDPLSQYRYQVRFEWGAPGAAAVGPGVDVVVWVDVLGASDSSRDTRAGLPARPLAGARIRPPAEPADPLDGAVPQAAVVAGCLRNRGAVARWVLSEQAKKGDRFTVAVIAAGAQRESGSARFTVEDLLAAGAVIDALAAVGIDYCSPEAAAACAAFTSLTRATGHLISASGSGQEFIDRGLRSEVDFATEIDAEDAVPVLRAAAAS
jgi:2-phosphosulfolactate phosphatase